MIKPCGTCGIAVGGLVTIPIWAVQDISGGIQTARYLELQTTNNFLPFPLVSYRYSSIALDTTCAVGNEYDGIQHKSSSFYVLHRLAPSWPSSPKTAPQHETDGQQKQTRTDSLHKTRVANSSNTHRQAYTTHTRCVPARNVHATYMALISCLSPVPLPPLVRSNLIWHLQTLRASYR